MRTKETKIRYTLYKDGVLLGQSPTLGGIASILGIHQTHITKQTYKTGLNTFTFRKITYVLEDKLN